MSRRHTVFYPLMVAACGFLVALIFCFVVYPHLENPLHVVLDPDGYGTLGMNLYKGEGFVFQSGDGPTIYRGPLYPVFIASFLAITGGWWPHSIWIAQSILQGLVCCLVFLFANKVWNHTTGLVAGLGSALYPVLFWYTPRMWNETLLMFLVMCLMYLLVSFLESATSVKAAGIAVVMALLCLVKATFLPLIFLVPFCFLIMKHKPLHAAIMFVGALVFLVPWTVRNYNLVKRIVPVHTGAGFNLAAANLFVRDFPSYPLSYDELWRKNIEQVEAVVSAVSSSRPLREIQEEDLYMAHAIDELKSDPFLIIRKIFVGSIIFWYMGENRMKTMLLTVLRLPVIVLGFIGVYHSIRQREKRLVPVFLVMAAYWIAHVPFAANARLSVPIMPVFFALATATLLRSHYVSEPTEGVV